MALKIQDNNSAVAYHVATGAFTFPYAIDAQQAITTHPNEWRSDPWPADEAATARKKLDLPEPEMSDEERAAIEDHNRAVAEAQARLDAVREKLAREKAEADQIAADEALVASPPPQVEVRRPFGRKGDPTPAEVAAMNKKAAVKDQAAMTGSTNTTSKPEQDKVEFAKPVETK